MLSKQKVFNFVLIFFSLSVLAGQAFYVFSKELHVYRLLSPLVFMYSIKNINKNLLVKYKPLLNFIFISYIYTILVHFFRQNSVEFNVFYNFFNVLFVQLIFILLLSNKYFTIKNLDKTLKISILVLIFFSLFENFTGTHLIAENAASRLYEKGYENFNKIPTVFYTNQNDLSFILADLIILNILFSKKNRLNILFLILTFYILLITQARLSILIVTIIFYLKLFNFNYKKTILFSSVTVLCLIYLFYEIISFPVIDFSLFERMEIYKASLNSAYESNFMGFGVNMSGDYLAKTFSRSDLVTNPHSFLLEVLINSGLFILSYYLLLKYYYIKQTKIKKHKVFVFIYLASLFASSSSLFIYFHYIIFIFYIAFAIDDEKIIVSKNLIKNNEKY